MEKDESAHPTDRVTSRRATPTPTPAMPHGSPVMRHGSPSPTESALARAQSLARKLNDAISRSEVNAWTHVGGSTASSESADSIELRALVDVHGALEEMAHRLHAMCDASGGRGSPVGRELRDFNALSEALEGARRAAFGACLKALEGVNEERSVVREVREFVEMPGDLEMMHRAEEMRGVHYQHAQERTTPQQRYFAGADDADVERREEETTGVRRAMTGGAYAPMFTPRTYRDNAYAMDAFESEVKSNRYEAPTRDSPGGMSEDSAYDDDVVVRGGKGGKTRRGDENGKGWVMFALGAVAVGAVMRFAASPQCAALKALCALRASDAKRRVSRAVRDATSKTVGGVKHAIEGRRNARATERQRRRADAGTARRSVYEVKHTRAALESESGLEALDHKGTTGVATVRIGPPNGGGFSTMPARDYRWKPSVMLGRG